MKNYENRNPILVNKKNWVKGRELSVRPVPLTMVLTKLVGRRKLCHTTRTLLLKS